MQFHVITQTMNTLFHENFIQSKLLLAVTPNTLPALYYDSELIQRTLVGNTPWKDILYNECLQDHDLAQHRMH